jgi:hypothetical protein
MPDRPTVHCIHDENLIRNHEAALATITTSLKDFMGRYETDKRECAERYRGDREESREWRSLINKRFDKVEDSLSTFSTFMQELKPNYKRAMALWGVIVLGALAIVWQMVWNHVTRIR